MRMSHFEDESSEQKYSLLFLTYDIFSLQFPNVLSLLKTQRRRGTFFTDQTVVMSFFSACLRPLRPLKIVAVLSVCMPKSRLETEVIDSQLV